MSLLPLGPRNLGLTTLCLLLIGTFYPTAADLTDDRYDLNTLFKKSLGFMTVDVQGMARVSLYHPNDSTTDMQGMYIWNALYFGREAAKQNYALQIKNIVESSREKLGEVPVIIGETGVPMDIK